MRPDKAIAPSPIIPPGPRALPLVGHLHYFARDVLGFFSACAREHGDVVRLQVGRWPALLLSTTSSRCS